MVPISEVQDAMSASAASVVQDEVVHKHFKAPPSPGLVLPFRGLVFSRMIKIEDQHAFFGRPPANSGFSGISKSQDDSTCQILLHKYVGDTVLAAVTPSWVVLTIWGEYRSPDALRVIEMETIASKEDQPLFFHPPKVR
jgi:hypothetical protein